MAASSAIFLSCFFPGSVGERYTTFWLWVLTMTMFLSVWAFFYRCTALSGRLHLEGADDGVLCHQSPGLARRLEPVRFRRHGVPLVLACAPCAATPGPAPGSVDVSTDWFALGSSQTASPASSAKDRFSHTPGSAATCPQGCSVCLCCLHPVGAVALGRSSFVPLDNSGASCPRIPPATLQIRLAAAPSQPAILSVCFSSLRSLASLHSTLFKIMSKV